jgi:hypothetical protein
MSQLSSFKGAQVVLDSGCLNTSGRAPLTDRYVAAFLVKAFRKGPQGYVDGIRGPTES